MAVPVPVRIVGSATVTFTGSSVDLGDLNGAATEAKQPTLGTAGAASADVLTVQGVASMTPLKVDGSAVTQPVSGTFYQTTQPVSQVGSWTVSVGADAVAYTPVGSETGLVVRPLANREELQIVRQLQVLTDELRMLRRVFQDWSGMGDPRHVFTDNVNVVQ